MYVVYGRGGVVLPVCVFDMIFHLLMSRHSFTPPASYVANASVIPTVCTVLGPDTIIYSDAKNHASLIDGIRAAKVPKRVFRHNDVTHLRELMAADQGLPGARVIIFESGTQRGYPRSRHRHSVCTPR